MLRMNVLKMNKFYRTKNLMMYTDPKDRNKNVMVSILSPSIEKEMEFIASGLISFPNFTRYYLNRVDNFKYYGKPQKRETNELTVFNKVNIETKYLDNPNLKLITSFFNPMPTNKVDLTKNFNIYYEANPILNNIINNDKEVRVASMIKDEFIPYFKTVFNTYTDKANFKYKNRYIIIPVHQWLDISKYKDPTTFNKRNKNFISMIYSLLDDNYTELSTILKDYKIIFMNHNEMIMMDFSIPMEEPAGILQDFLKKCRSVNGFLMTDEDSDVDTNTTKELEVDSNIDNEVDKLLSKSNIDLNKLPEDKRAEFKEVVKTKISNSTSSEVTLNDIKKATTEIEVDDIIGANLSGKTIANYKRDQLLREKYKELSFKGRKLTDIIKDEEKYTIPDYKLPINTINESLEDIKSYNIAKAYNNQLADHDLMNILLHFSTCKPALFLITDPIVEDISDSLNKVLKYTVQFEDENRKRHKFSFLMPKMYRERYLFLNESQWDLTHQKFPFSVTKIAPEISQFCTNYKKVFIMRSGNNISPRVTKLKKSLLANKVSYLKVTTGDSTKVNKSLLTSIEYDELGKEITKIVVGDYRIFFIAEDAKISMPNNQISYGKIPLGFNSKTKECFFLDGATNIVYNEKKEPKGELSDFIINIIGIYSKNFEESFAGISAGSKFTYANTKIMGEMIPLVLVLSASDPGGLRSILDKAKIKYEFTEKRPKVDNNTQGVISFEDGYLSFDRYPYENSLLLNGLSNIDTKAFKFEQMNLRDTYVDIFDTLYGNRKLIDGLENFYYLMMDPITQDVARRTGYPTTYIESLLFSCGVLADNNYSIDSSYDNCRIRGNEIINVYLYQELANAYVQYKIGRSPKFSIQEDIVLKQLMTVELVDSHTQLNLSTEMENNRAVKMKGPVGLNVSRAYTLPKRAYDESMSGIIASNSTPSGEVGIKRYMTLNVNITDARGFIEVNKKDYDGTELLSAGEMMNTFSIESSDAERSAMGLSQSKHTVPTLESSPSIISFDMGRVAPYLSSDFTHVAKEDGEVVEIKNDIMIVKYKSGKYDDIDLAEKPDKNSNGGFEIMNRLVTELKVGSKFKANTILAYNDKYIDSKDIFGDNVATEGTMARVMIISDGSVYEDSTYVTSELAQKLSSKITTNKNVILSKFSNIKFMAKKGQKIGANEPLLIFDDTKDEFTSQLLLSMAEEVEDSDEIVATNAPVVSKVAGRVADIKIYYTIPEAEMSPSLKKIIKEYSNEVSSRAKVISKYINTKDANTILTPTTQIEPDKNGKIKGIQVGEGVLIEFHIEYLDVFGIGDKITHYGPLKGINNDIIDSKYAAFTESNPDKKIDAALSENGFYKRMTLDVYKVGGLSKLCIEKKRKLKEKYADRIKKEL